MTIRTLALTALLAASTLSIPAFADEGGKRGGGDYQAKRAAHMEKALEAFPEDKRALVKSTLSEGRASGESTYEQIKTHKDGMRSALTAETFDENSFRSNAAKVHELYKKRHADMNERIIGLAKQLNAEERKALAEILPKKKRKRGGKK